MESLKSILSLEIPTNRMSYDKKTDVLSIQILDFMFVGTYKKSVRISKILDDIHASLREYQVERNEIYIVDFVTSNKIAETRKLKHLKLSKKEKPKKKEKEPLDKQTPMKKEKKEKYEVAAEEAEEEYYEEELRSFASDADDTYGEEVLFKEEKALAKDEREVEIHKEKDVAKSKRRAMAPPSEAPKPSSAPPAPPDSEYLGGPRAPPPASPASTATVPEEPQPIVYEINMGLQYYSVMMEQRSYLFYVYFSHKELKIVDEEGKTIYETTITIVTTKEEPPVLDLKIEGEGFEVHPIFGKVEVKKDAVNPPVMIFSIMPTKSKKEKKKKKESERRFLSVYIDFEGKTISHTILSIIVQPKYFRLDIGPIHLNVSKKAAAIISFISILVAGASLVYTLFSFDPSSALLSFVSGFAPGLGSILFFAIFLYTLFKEGIYPLKEKISAFLNFDQTGVLIK
ncbi:MAG: hypothetical protein ACFFG0_05915 [Candidatus Thorarchaeota archaeon]